mmetsp:Transcript_170329/g.540941  ORF Transcript_170329/g.540941 Transcript_170329/m.540941 type:complete len:241 (+) Transcript_170329:103-825(+)
MPRRIKLSTPLRSVADTFGTEKLKHAGSPRLDIVPAIDLHLLDVLLRILLGVVATSPDCVDDGLSHLRRGGTTGAAEGQVAALLVDEVVDELLLLLKTVGHIDLLLLLATQGQAHVLQHALLLVVVELLLVAVLGTVPGAEEEGHLTASLSISLRGSTLLDEGPHRGDAGAEGDHEEGRLVRLGHGHGRGVHGGAASEALLSGLNLAKPVGREADAIPAAGGSPLVLDDAEVASVLAAEA